jgi:multicomponent Na+:H+ antiporter subunit F
MPVLIQLFYLGLCSCCFMCLYRIGRGPTAPDRTVAIDILGIVIVGFCALLGLATGKDFYLNVALAWALLSFIGTIALAKFLEGRGFDE